MPPWHSQTNGHLGTRPVTRELSGMLKTSASFVLGSSKSSTYPRGYASGFDSPAALLGSGRVSARRGWAGENRGRFEHPASWKASVLLLVVLLSQSWLPLFAQTDETKKTLPSPENVRVFDTPSDGGSSLTV